MIPAYHSIFTIPGMVQPPPVKKKQRGRYILYNLVLIDDHMPVHMLMRMDWKKKDHICTSHTFTAPMQCVEIDIENSSFVSGHLMGLL